MLLYVNENFTGHIVFDMSDSIHEEFIEYYNDNFDEFPSAHIIVCSY